MRPLIHSYIADVLSWTQMPQVIPVMLPEYQDPAAFMTPGHCIQKQLAFTYAASAAKGPHHHCDIVIIVAAVTAYAA